MKWIVSRDEDGKSGLVEIDFTDVIKFSTLGTRIQLHTRDEVFYFPFDTLEKIQTVLETMDMPFTRSDRGNLINMDKVVDIDVEYAIAYFEGDTPGERGKEATISKPNNFNRILELFRKRQE